MKTLESIIKKKISSIDKERKKLGKYAQWQQQVPYLNKINLLQDLLDTFKYQKDK